MTVEKARAAVLLAAKRWRNNIGMDRYELELLVALDALDAVESPPCPHVANDGDCDLELGHPGQHSPMCNDGSCCEPPEPHIGDAIQATHSEAMADIQRRLK